MEYINIEKRIKDNFKDHVATLTKQGDLTVLDWKNPITNLYYVRYVFDKNNVYVTGDLGGAVFCLTWTASIHSFDNVSYGYFHEKLEAYNEDKYDFDSNVARERLEEWKEELDEEEIEYNEDEMEDLLGSVFSCDNEYQWVETVNEYDDFVSNLDFDYWEWFYFIGRTYPVRFQSYLIGLKMASEQLKK